MKLKVILRNDMRKFSYFKFSEEKKNEKKNLPACGVIKKTLYQLICCQVKAFAKKKFKPQKQINLNDSEGTVSATQFFS